MDAHDCKKRAFWEVGYTCEHDALKCTDFAKQILVDYARLLDQSAPMEDYSPWWLGCRSCDISMGVVVAPRLGFQS
jgi:hypothetical protein